MSNEYSNIRTNGPIPDPGSANTSEMIEDLWQAYVDSASSLLSELEVADLEYENGNNLEENAGSIRRILHSIKGESGIIGIHIFRHVQRCAFFHAITGKTASVSGVRRKDLRLFRSFFSKNISLFDGLFTIT